MNPVINRPHPQPKPEPGCTAEGSGFLAPCAPLANPFVPFQRVGAQQYEPPKALVRGTLYPGLDLPFMGKVNQNPLPDTPMHNLQQLGFMIQELVLYLDTHPEDKEAAELLQECFQQYHKSVGEYTKTHGPLFSATGAANGEYQWLQNPWPWEYQDHKED